MKLVGGPPDWTFRRNEPSGALYILRVPISEHHRLQEQPFLVRGPPESESNDQCGGDPEHETEQHQRDADA
jgi:hypothetical protein